MKPLRTLSDLNLGLLCSGDCILRRGDAERIKFNPSLNALVGKSEHSRKKLANDTPQTKCAVQVVSALSPWPLFF